MDIIISILAFLFLIGLVVSIHEGGHFLIARLCGMKVLEFSLGFGKKIYETTLGADKTKFTLRMLPLGGFVKTLDEGNLTEEEWKALSEEEKSRSFNRAPKWKKFAMVAGGPLANFILAFVVYIIALSFVGNKVTPAIISEIVPTGVFAESQLKANDKIIEINGKKVNYLSEVFPVFINTMIAGGKVDFNTEDNKYHIDFAKVDLNDMSNVNLGKTMGFYFTGLTGDILIKEVSAKSVADEAGLKAGDILKAINNEEMDDMNKLIRRIQENAGKEIVLTVLRNEKLITLNLIPVEKLDGKQKVGKIGVTFDMINNSNNEVMKYSIAESVPQSINKVVSASYTTLISFKKLITGELSAKAISGPIAIADYSGKSAQKGLYFYLMMIASISIAIGVFNLLPIPMLDGGHLAQYIIEMVIRKDLPIKVIQYFQYIGFGILASVFSFSILNDLTKYLL